MHQRRALSTTIIAVVVIVVVLAVGTGFYAYSSAPRSVSTTSISTNTTFTPSNSEPSSSTVTTCIGSTIAATSTNDSAVFNLQTMPSNFTVGAYRFVIAYNGTDYAYTSDGSVTQDLGYNLVFDIIQGSETQMVAFGSAPPAPYPPSVPSPSTATVFGGDVHMQWASTCNAIFFEISTTNLPTTASTNTSTSCSFNLLGGNSDCTYDYTFTISVNYTGPWKLTYQGYNNLGESNPTGVGGNDTGTGFYSKAVTMSSVDTGGLTLCATAQKLDGSNNTLILTVTGYNETSLPYGSTSYCGSVVP